jgi:hypothetical protein
MDTSAMILRLASIDELVFFIWLVFTMPFAPSITTIFIGGFSTYHSQKIDHSY